MTTTQQPEQPTERIDPMLLKFREAVVYSTVIREWMDKADAMEKELSKRLAGPSLTVIEQAIRRTIEDWAWEKRKHNAISGDEDDLVDRLRDAFVELMEGKME